MKRFLDPLAENLNFSKIDIGFLYLKILNISLHVWLKFRFCRLRIWFAINSGFVCSLAKNSCPNFFPPQIAFFVLQKGIEGGLDEVVVCGVVCIVYSILPLHVLLNLKQVLVLHVGKNVSVVVRGCCYLTFSW